MNITPVLWLAVLSVLANPAIAVQAEQDAAAVEPPSLDCSMSTPRSRTMLLRSALAKGFGVQYWGDTYSAARLAEQPHGLLVLETAKIGAAYNDTGRELFFTPEEIATISHDGSRPVLGYLNVSEIEIYRDYWLDQPADAADRPAWSGPETAHDEHLAAYWTPPWREIMLARVDRLMATGLSGLFLDDVLHYYNFAQDEAVRWPDGKPADAPTQAADFAVRMMELVEAIAARARVWNCNAMVVVNNGVFIGRDANGALAADGRPAFAAYVDAIDAIMVENLFAPEAHPHTMAALKEDFQDHGVPVLSLDIAPQPEGEEFERSREAIAARAQASGFFPYVARGSAFDQLAPPITPAVAPQAAEAPTAGTPTVGG